MTHLANLIRSKSAIVIGNLPLEASSASKQLQAAYRMHNDCFVMELQE